MASIRLSDGVFLLQVLLVPVPYTKAFSTGPLVTLKQGRYRGNFVTSPSGQHVAEYLGIPFAKPPVRELRLANPQPLELAPDTLFNAKRYGPSCPQVLDTVFGDFIGSARWNPTGEISEDCLYLNVWVPQGNSQQDKNVMVWIYGGGFYSGSTSLPYYNGKTLAAVGDVIIVSISYRLGALGFLSTGDGRIPGNFGLMDQVMALTWVRDNIRDFGGHPEKVTIFGESAGGNSVLYHILSPLSNGLFQRAIMESPASNRYVFVGPDKAKMFSRSLLEKLNCPNNNRSIECLRGRPVSRFLEDQFISDGESGSPFPTISPFLPERPEVMMDELNFKKKDILLGMNKNEGTDFMLYRLNSVSLSDKVNGQNQQNVKDAIKYIASDLDEQQRKDIFDFYTKGIDSEDSIGNRDVIGNIQGDRLFVCTVEHVVETQARTHDNTYLYLYNHRASNDPWPEWMGVMHGAEIMFVFGQPLNASNGYTQAEKRFSERVMAYWTNFAKSGNPNNQGNTPWPKYTPDRKEFLELSVHEKRHEGGYRTDECRFWSDLVNSGSRHFSQLASVSVIALITFVLLVL